MRSLSLLLLLTIITACAIISVHASIEIDVADYGAKGDGVTDDTEAIVKANIALLAQSTSGGSMYFGQGTYLLASDPKLYSAPNPLAYLSFTSNISTESSSVFGITGSGSTTLLWNASLAMLMYGSNSSTTQENLIGLSMYNIAVTPIGPLASLPMMQWDNVSDVNIQYLNFNGNDNYQGTLFLSLNATSVELSSIVYPESWILLNVARDLQSLSLSNVNLTGGLEGAPYAVLIDSSSIQQVQFDDSLFIDLPHTPLLIVNRPGTPVSTSIISLENVQFSGTLGGVHIADNSSLSLNGCIIDAIAFENTTGIEFNSPSYEVCGQLQVYETNFKNCGTAISQKCGASQVTSSTFQGGQNGILYYNSYAQNTQFTFSSNTFTNITHLSISGAGNDINVVGNSCLYAGAVAAECLSGPTSGCTVEDNDGCVMI